MLRYWFKASVVAKFRGLVDHIERVRYVLVLVIDRYAFDLEGEKWGNE